MTPEAENTGAAAPTLSAALRKENLNAAWSKVKANDGCAGADGKSIAATKEHLREHWAKIEPKLLPGSYCPAAQGYVEEGKGWVVDIDLKGFFDHIDHDKLMHEVSGLVRDKGLLRLIGSFLRAPMQHPDGSRSGRGKGTPQGGPLPPLLANIYPTPLDRELERRGLSFVRYADDIAIFARSERAARRVPEGVVRWIEENLKVPVNRDKSGCGKSGEGSLLGFPIYEDGRIGVSPKAVEKLKANVRDLWDARQSLTSNQLRDQWRRYITGWWNYFSLADWRREVENLSGWIRRHMRKCFWLRWHNRKGRRRALARLGVRGRALGNAGSSRGAWAMSRHFVVNQALNNKCLARYGFVLPWNLPEARG